MCHKRHSRMSWPMYMYNMSQCMRFPTMWYVRPAKPQISLRIRAVWSELCWSMEYFMIVKLLTEHHFEFLSLKEGYRGSSESTLVKMSNCWKSHATAHKSLLPICSFVCLSNGLVGPCSSEGVVKVIVTPPPGTFSFVLLSSSVKIFKHMLGSLVECLTQNRGAAGLSLTNVTALWSLSMTHLS